MARTRRTCLPSWACTRSHPCSRRRIQTARRGGGRGTRCMNCAACIAVLIQSALARRATSKDARVLNTWNSAFGMPLYRPAAHGSSHTHTPGSHPNTQSSSSRDRMYSGQRRRPTWRTANRPRNPLAARRCRTLRTVGIEQKERHTVNSCLAVKDVLLAITARMSLRH
jgi:hypothetical protein